MGDGEGDGAGGLLWGVATFCLLFASCRLDDFGDAAFEITDNAIENADGALLVSFSYLFCRFRLSFSPPWSLPF